MPRSLPGGLQAELKQNIPFTSREQEAYLSLMRTVDALQAQVEARLKEFGLTGTQYNALRILRGAGREGLPCREIGDRMITRDPDITRLSPGRARLGRAHACQTRSPRHLRKDQCGGAETSSRNGRADGKVRP